MSNPIADCLCAPCDYLYTYFQCYRDRHDIGDNVENDRLNKLRFAPCGERESCITYCCITLPSDVCGNDETGSSKGSCKTRCALSLKEFLRCASDDESNMNRSKAEPNYSQTDTESCFIGRCLKVFCCFLGCGDTTGTERESLVGSQKSAELTNSARSSYHSAVHTQPMSYYL